MQMWQWPAQSRCRCGQRLTACSVRIAAARRHWYLVWEQRAGDVSAISLPQAQRHSTSRQQYPEYHRYCKCHADRTEPLRRAAARLQAADDLRTQADGEAQLLVLLTRVREQLHERVVLVLAADAEDLVLDLPVRVPALHAETPSPVSVQNVAAASRVTSQCRCGRGEPSPGADAEAASPVPLLMRQG